MYLHHDIRCYRKRSMFVKVMIKRETAIEEIL